MPIVCSVCYEDTEDHSPGASICRGCRRERYKTIRYCETCKELLIGGGSHVYCKPCKSSYDKIHKAKKLKEYRDYISGIGCKSCGENHPYCLEVHHLFKGAKRFKNNRSQGHECNRQDLEKKTAMVLYSCCHSIFHTHFGGKKAYFPPQTEASVCEIIDLERRVFICPQNT